MMNDNIFISIYLAQTNIVFLGTISRGRIRNGRLPFKEYLKQNQIRLQEVALIYLPNFVNYRICQASFKEYRTACLKQTIMLFKNCMNYMLSVSVVDVRHFVV